MGFFTSMGLLFENQSGEFDEVGDELYHGSIDHSRRM